MTGRIIILILGIVILAAGLFLLRASSKNMPISAGTQNDIAFGDQPPMLDAPSAPPSKFEPPRRTSQKPPQRPQQGSNLQRSKNDGRQLFEKNCYVCHGQRGEGDGPGAVVLDERPRNFRTEPFKYVSSANGKPTRADLTRTIREGRILGRMPAFRHLDVHEIDTLIDYVLELRRRGLEEKLVQAAKKKQDASLTPEKISTLALQRASCGKEIEVTQPPQGFKPHPDSGRKLFATSCASCHGVSGRGDGNAMPRDEQGMPIRVRDLTAGRFQGGTEPQELFWRIRCGIPGTPMAAQKDLKDEDIWQLVYFVKSLADPDHR